MTSTRDSSLSRTLRPLLAVCMLAVLAACSDGSDKKLIELLLSGCADTNSCAPNPPLQIGGDRPSEVHIPSDYDPNTRYPLVVVLHGFGAFGSIQFSYFGLPAELERKKFIAVTPDGTLNSEGNRFWNATDACCAPGSVEENVDDVAYIRGLIEEAAATYSVDTSRVALIGHSNGGFMALRMACEASDLVTTVISFAGSTWDDAARCAPATYPVSVMALHGTADETIAYEGSTRDGFSYPSAPTTAERFAVLAGCNPGNTTALPSIDMLVGVAGDETDILGYNDCLRGASVELWTINDGVHIPFPWTDGGIDALSSWLIEHPR